MTLWRIAREAPTHGAADLSGKGAELTGARWNRKEVPMIYTSTTRALACLETLVHLEDGEPSPMNRYLVRLDIPRECWTQRRRFGSLRKHVGWDAEPPGLVSQEFGSVWATENKTLLLQVPSIVVEEEPNVLINPRHADCARVRATKVRKWIYDRRLGP